MREGGGGEAGETPIRMMCLPGGYVEPATNIELCSGQPSLTLRRATKVLASAGRAPQRLPASAGANEIGDTNSRAIIAAAASGNPDDEVHDRQTRRGSRGVPAASWRSPTSSACVTAMSW